MKKFDIFKTIQLIIFIILTVICTCVIFFDTNVRVIIGTNPGVRLVCGLLVLVLCLSFLWIFLDFSLFSGYKKDYRELDYAVHSDPISGIANRFSCDALIEKYLDKPLPKNIGCIMFELTNIVDINRLYGHIHGNTLIRDFSNILQKASRNTCFVGRNGGNKFLALFENARRGDIEAYLMRVSQKINTHNESTENFPIEYRYGVAYDEGLDVKMITDLIALSNRRIEQG